MSDSRWQGWSVAVIGTPQDPFKNKMDVYTGAGRTATALAMALSEDGLRVTAYGIGDRVLYDIDGNPISVEQINIADLQGAGLPANAPLPMATPNYMWTYSTFIDRVYRRIAEMPTPPDLIVDNTNAGAFAARTNRDYRERLARSLILVPQHMPNHPPYGEVYAGLKGLPGVQLYGLSMAQGTGPFIHHGLLSVPEIKANWETYKKPQRRICWIGRPGEERSEDPSRSDPKGLFEMAEIAIALRVPVDIIVRVNAAEEPSWREFKREYWSRLKALGSEIFVNAGEAEKMIAFDRCAALAAPQGWNEPFGLVVNEATVKFRPTFGYKIGGLRAQVIDNVTGYLVPFGQRQELIDRLGSYLNSLDTGFDPATGRREPITAKNCFDFATRYANRGRMGLEILALADALQRGVPFRSRSAYVEQQFVRSGVMPPLQLDDSKFPEVAVGAAAMSVVERDDRPKLVLDDSITQFRADMDELVEAIVWGDGRFRNLVEDRHMRQLLRREMSFPAHRLRGDVARSTFFLRGGQYPSASLLQEVNATAAFAAKAMVFERCVYGHRASSSIAAVRAAVVAANGQGASNDFRRLVYDATKVRHLRDLPDPLLQLCELADEAFGYVSRSGNARWSSNGRPHARDVDETLGRYFLSDIGTVLESEFRERVYTAFPSVHDDFVRSLQRIHEECHGAAGFWPRAKRRNTQLADALSTFIEYGNIDPNRRESWPEQQAELQRFWLSQVVRDIDAFRLRSTATVLSDWMKSGRAHFQSPSDRWLPYGESAVNVPVAHEISVMCEGQEIGSVKAGETLVSTVADLVDETREAAVDRPVAQSHFLISPPPMEFRGLS